MNSIKNRIALQHDLNDIRKMAKANGIDLRTKAGWQKIQEWAGHIEAARKAPGTKGYKHFQKAQQALEA